MTKIVSDDKIFTTQSFWVKIVKGILFGVGTYHKLYFGSGNITEKDQLTHFLFYTALLITPWLPLQDITIAPIFNNFSIYF